MLGDLLLLFIGTIILSPVHEGTHLFFIKVLGYKTIEVKHNKILFEPRHGKGVLLVAFAPLLLFVPAIVLLHIHAPRVLTAILLLLSIPSGDDVDTGLRYMNINCEYIKTIMNGIYIIAWWTVLLFFL